MFMQFKAWIHVDFSGALEGLCACYVTVAKPALEASSAKVASLPRNQSFNVVTSRATPERDKNKGDITYIHIGYQYITCYLEKTTNRI